MRKIVFASLTSNDYGIIASYYRTTEDRARVTYQHIGFVSKARCFKSANGPVPAIFNRKKAGVCWASLYPGERIKIYWRRV